jgi:hypothetical protein
MGPTAKTRIEETEEKQTTEVKPVPCNFQTVQNNHHTLPLQLKQSQQIPESLVHNCIYFI